VGEDPTFAELVYEERTVAFIDVLGWRNAIRGPSARSAGELGWAVHLLRQVASGLESQRKFFAQMNVQMPGMSAAVEASQFSDSIVVSVPAGEGHYLLQSCLDQLTTLACQNRLLLRGGIARGQVYHKEGMVYGPALIDAYDLEQAASMPRIVLDKSLEDEFLQASGLREADTVYGYRKSWRRDHDGRLFFDFMQPFGASHIFPESGRPPWQPNINFLTNYKSLIISGVLNNQGNVGVVEKYMWAFRYFMDVANEYPDLVVGDITVDTSNGLRGFRGDEWPYQMCTMTTGA
jgi:hypothetical protein